jgi:hypothetical protein
VAIENKPITKLPRLNFVAANHNLALQKSSAVPELTVGLEYDKQSNFNPNYFWSGTRLAYSNRRIIIKEILKLQKLALLNNNW